MRNRLGQFAVVLDTFKSCRTRLLFLAILGTFSAFLDGLGISIIVPLLSFLLNGGGVPTDPVSAMFHKVFLLIGIPFSFKIVLFCTVILFLVRAGMLALFSYLRARIEANFMYTESSGLIRSMLSASWSFLVHKKAGYLQNTSYWDVRQSVGLLDALVQIIQSGTGVVIYLVVAFSISPTITGITLVAGIILVSILRTVVNRTMLIGKEYSVVEKQFSHSLIEHVTGLKSIKSSGVEHVAAETDVSLLDRMRHMFIASTLIQTIGTSLIQPFGLIFVVVLFSIAYLLPGFNLAAFAATIYLIQKIFTYLQSTQSAVQAAAGLVPFVDNIAFFKSEMRTDSLQPSGHRSFIFEQSLDFDDVSLMYSSGTQALSDISFSIPRGSLLGIVGKSGGGKTSLADVILRLFKPTGGQVLLDGVPIDEVRIGEWRTHVGYVSQDVFLMNASIRDNIRFYDANVTDEAIIRAAKQAYIYDHIIGLEHGFDTMIGDRGVMLSGGQRQRIVLARALARDPSLLILDEATSSLDSESELAIKRAIEEMHGRVTLIIIAHRMATVLEADDILVIKEGKIDEHGAPAEMLADSDSYLSRMKSLQSSL